MLILETVINRYLALDPEMLDKLGQFSGKVIKLEITGINKVFFIYPGDGGMQVTTEHEGHVDTVLRGSPASLLKMGLVSNAASLLLKGEVEIEGDTRLGHQFKNILSQMDIDWSEPLSSMFGDAAAYQIQQTGSSLGEWSKKTIASFSNSVSEYLQEESRDVVTETELEIFCEEVDRLRNDTDRLQARINLLTKKQQQ